MDGPLKKSMSLFIPTAVRGLQFFYFMNLTDKVTATIEKWCFYMKVAIGGYVRRGVHLVSKLGKSQKKCQKNIDKEWA